MIGDRWGATDAEVVASYPCDPLLPPGARRCHRALSIAAPVPLVFRWLCQLRAAPYSYDLIDNLGRRSPPELTPGLDALAPGQRFMVVFALTSFTRDEHLTMRSGRRTAITYAVTLQGAGTRVAVRAAVAMPHVVAAPLLLGDLVMMRRQLLTLKRYAERDAVAARGQDHA